MLDIPIDLPKTVIETTVTRCSHNLSYQISNHLAAIIKPRPIENLPYTKLECTEHHKTVIKTIISLMGENGKLWLLANKGKMNQLGEEIRTVHPLKFLETIFSNGYLVKCMAIIFDDYFKKKGFMDGLGSSLDAKFQTGELKRYMADFAESLGISKKLIEPYFKNADWDNLVYFLIDELYPEDE